ncbi:site-specific recombinase XerD [Arcicella aurantiaca]|uniref:Site-specific recombinase XerD n=1 Tax=Arcicella aurantiaca TaxID=591202 RepID=A0A316EDK2_9BACT|nr:site-specific integrase [Arcicella aurantiaca]PWK28226.1 site-specific recombinase XerD [Arcicella aurantiaca]
MATIDVVLFTSKVLKNGESPIMVRLIKDRKSKYISVGESCSKALWDDKKNLPSKKHPLAKEMVIKIEKTKMEAKRLLMKLEDEQTDFSAEEFTKKLKNQSRKTTVIQFLDEVIADLLKVDKVGNANIHKNLRNVILRFRNQKDFTFSELDGAFLRKFEQDFRERGVTEVSMSVYFRTLRALYNRAIVEDFAKKESDPFIDFKVSKFNTKTKKRAITKEDILKIASLQIEKDTQLYHSQNVFLYSYYCSGMNISDILELQWKDISPDNLMDYERNKTHQQIKVQLLPPAKKILAYYRKYSVGDYVFPYLDKAKHKTEVQINNRIKKVTKQINKDLKTLAQMAGIDVVLTTYVARHTFATVLKRSGVEISKISELLGHDSEKTTKIYLGDFENEELYEATLNLL